MVAPVLAPHSGQLTIVGGGITGLSAAYRAIQNGQDPKRITILEATDRLGGKIQTGYFADGSAVNMGAEFVDSEHTQLLELCRELGVALTPAAEEDGQEFFQAANGKPITGEAFHAAFAPLHAQILRDKAEVLAQPNGVLAQRMNQLSMAEYLEEVRVRTPVDVHAGLVTRVMHLFRSGVNRVSQATTQMAMQGFASELGRPARETNALQFLHEISGEKETLLASDCGFRVTGGTQEIIDALEEKLKAHGVAFERKAPVQAVEKTERGLKLQLPEGRSMETDRVLLALPAYALAGVQGLEALGMPEGLRGAIGDTQYTKGAKLTVKLKPGMAAQRGAFFADGYQVWSAGPDQVTFLINFDAANGAKTPAQAAERAMQDYAAARGLDAAAYYDRSAGNMILTSPGTQACYASPARGQALMLEKIQQAAQPMEAQGVAIAGTYLPLRSKSGVELGFMECGVNSAAQAIDRLVPPVRERAGWMEQILNPIAKASAPDVVAATR